MPKKLISVLVAIVVVLVAVAIVAVRDTPPSIAGYSPNQLPYDVETGKMFPTVSSKDISPSTSASNITVSVSLNASQPFFGKPKGYSLVSASESAYLLAAKCVVNNNGYSVGSTAWVTQTDALYSNSGTITALTDLCSFVAYGKVKETASSQESSGYTGPIYFN
ncbi:MAG: hypothetical protein LBT59_01825 [Clostridiales bacterium]|jgi:hypothetical protein|nr:hypothetical protein [Clostridiales bacterium]